MTCNNVFCSVDLFCAVKRQNDFKAQISPANASLADAAVIIDIFLTYFSDKDR